MKRTRYLVAVAAVVGLILLLVVVTRPTIEAEAKPEKAAPLSVRTATATMDTFGAPFEVGGSVRARETATISSRIIAEIRQIHVRPGDHVLAGQPLVSLDARDLNAGRARAVASIAAAEQSAQLAAAERQAAEAALALATVTHRRISELRQKNSATPGEMDEADATLRAAQARVKSAEAGAAAAAANIEVARAAAQSASVSESWATLVAPFDGIVTQKLVDAGNMASPGMALLAVEDEHAFRLEVRVDEGRAALVNVGQAVDVLLDGTAAPVAGHVVELSRMVDSSAHAFLAKIELPATAGLRSGMFGRARFAGPASRVLVIPEAAVTRRGQLASVFVVDRSGTARLRLVTLGESNGGRVEVRAGLDAGETIVVAPPPALVDGTPVRATEAR
jgi:RND family efflux transporter MFP subunit